MTDKKYRKGLFVGRFQPFHLGHLSGVKQALEHCDEVIIGIGSPDKSGTEDNPFDVDTRISVIIATLRDANIDSSKIKFFIIPDFKTDDEWYTYIVSSHNVDAVFTGNEWVSGIFKGKNVDIVNPLLNSENKNLNATDIRESIRTGKPWAHCLKESAAKLVESNKEKIEKTAKKQVLV